MNKLLERAFTELAKLPDAQQEAIARDLLDQLESDKGWDDRFARSQGVLCRLSKRAGEHIAEATTLPFDPSDRPAR
jgi:hypothetical protein